MLGNNSKAPNGTVTIDFGSGTRGTMQKYTKKVDIPKPLYFVVLHPLTKGNPKIYTVLSAHTKPSVRLAFSNEDSTKTKEFKWIKTKKRWYEVNPGTRIQITPAPYVLGFERMKDIEDRMYEVEDVLLGGSPIKKFRM